jgi:hypothetical protein
MSKPEIIFKFSNAFPVAKTIKETKKIQVDIHHEGIIFTACLNAKSWRKAQATVEGVDNWGGAIKGKLGAKTRCGFEVLEAGINVYEKKSKELEATDTAGDE